MSTPERAPDELDARIRALEAERLRPVPPTPKPTDNDFPRRIDAFQRRLKTFGQHHHPPADEEADA